MLKPLFRPNAYVSGARISVLRWLSALVLIASLFMFVISLPARSDRLFQLGSQAQLMLVDRTQWSPNLISLTPTLYQLFGLGFEILVMGLFLLNGLLIYRMRSDDWQSLLTSAGLASFALHITPTMITWMQTYPRLEFFGILMKCVGLGLAFLFLYLFPGGYYAPPWMRLFLIAWIVWSMLWLANPGSVISFNDPYTISISGAVLLLLWWSVGVFSQVYRFRYASGPLERQQSKYVLYGATITFLAYCVYIPTREVIAQRPPADAVHLLFTLFAPYIYLVFVTAIPITIAISILRFRLFDIDIIIRRTISYAILTALLTLVYFSSVALFQTIYTSFRDGQSQFAIVISTLGIAALVSPLRSRIQRSIDRRFYRSKYDAEKSLERFTDRIREDVDLDRIVSYLAEAVEDTMQPQDLAIWLSHTPQKYLSGRQPNRL